MRGGLEKSARKFYAGQAKCGAGLCGTDQLALPPLNHSFSFLILEIGYWSSFLSTLELSFRFPLSFVFFVH